ncbi:MAG: alpha/beta hydrolase [Dongiaceae bacterium]
MRRNKSVLAGQVRQLALDSKILKDNPLGDPAAREIRVYLPPGHAAAGGLPLLVDLVGYTGSGIAHTNWRAFTENVPERLDRLIGEGKMQPVVVAFPDCFTRLGGNQYINSAAIGRYEDFLCEEVVPFVEAEANCGGTGRRGLFGKSSGGYGAIMHGMRRPDVWAAIACHSGDMAFEFSYMAEMPLVLNALAKHDRSIEKFMAYFEQVKKPKGSDITLLNMLAMAASYDPDPRQFLGIRLPVDLETGELIAERWLNWLAHDPAIVVDKYAGNLRKLKAIYIDCGDEDQYHLHFGSRRLHRALDRLKIAHTYEEFPDNHSDVDYRMDVSLPFLERALR